MKKIVSIFVGSFIFFPLTVCIAQSTTHPADQCQTLTCARVHIDEINEQLVKLIAERLRYVKRVGELKGQAIPIHDPARENAILNKVGAQAEKLGYDASIAQAIFKTILEQSRQYEKAQNQKSQQP